MKKFLSTLLAIAMIFACTATALADATRHTDFFTDQEHTDLNYGDIEYEHIDPEPLLKEADDIRDLTADPANTQKVQTRFLAFKDEMFRMYAMYCIVENRVYADASDRWAAKEYETVYTDLITVMDAFNGLVRDILMSGCRDAIASMMTEEDIEAYVAYEDMDAEYQELSAQNAALENEYRDLATREYSMTYKGKKYTDDSAYSAYSSGMIDYETYLTISRQIAKEANRDFGALYLRMIEVRNKIAQSSGFDNYAEYAYPMSYNRDYTIEDIEKFSAAVKQYLVPMYSRLSESVTTPNQSLMPAGVVYTGSGVFDTLAPYFGQLSDELLESMMYVKDHGSYDIKPGANKTGTAYSLMIPYYNMPYFYNNAYGDSYAWVDLLTTIHEMGHNNEAYWKPNDWNDPSTDMDTAEVHSQGLELLMIHFYPELFRDQADKVELYTMSNILYSVIQGCMHDELQRYAYSTPNVTLQQINEEYRRIAGEYGIVDADDPRTEMYGWYDIPHTFTSPMYYISYATSAAGAFAFWEESQQDYFGAVDHYLEFTAQSNWLSFQETFEAVNLESPLTQSYVKGLSKTIHNYLMPFTDVDMEAWYDEYVYFCYSNGLINGTTETTFSPENHTTREQAMTILARFDAALLESEDTYTLEQGVAWAVENDVCDGSDPHGDLSREQLALMLYNFAALYGVDTSARGDLSQFSDAASISADAQDAMAWAVGAGLIGGMGDGTVNPLGTTTRAQFATLLERFYMNCLVG